MKQIPDHPSIRFAERTGYGPCRADRVPVCPVCGAECDTAYINFCGRVIGCENCIGTADAYETDECFPGEGY